MKFSHFFEEDVSWSLVWRLVRCCGFTRTAWTRCRRRSPFSRRTGGCGNSSCTFTPRTKPSKCGKIANWTRASCRANTSSVGATKCRARKMSATSGSTSMSARTLTCPAISFTSTTATATPGYEKQPQSRKNWRIFCFYSKNLKTSQKNQTKHTVRHKKLRKISWFQEFPFEILYLYFT